MQTVIPNRENHKSVRFDLLKKIKNVKLKKLSEEYFKYCLIGVLVTGLDFFILTVEVELLHIYYLIAASISYSIAAVVHYFLSADYVFSDSATKKGFYEFFVFLLLGVIGLLLYELFMWLFVNFGHIHYLIAKIFSTGVTFSFNFFSRKYILFR